MDIRLISMREEMYEKAFPAYAEKFEEEAISAFGAFEEETLLGSCVVVSIGDGIYSVRYLEAEGENREEIIRALLQHIERLCIEELMATSLTVFLVDAEQKMVEMHALLSKLGYKENEPKKRYVKYTLRDICHTTFADGLSKRPEILKNIYRYNELTNGQIADFSSRLQKQTRHAGFDMPDLVFGRYYVEKGLIEGFIDVREVSEGILLMTDMYVLDSTVSQMALPFMLAATLGTAEAFLTEDAEIYMVYASENLYRAIQKVFGVGQLDEVILSCEKQLDV